MGDWDNQVLAKQTEESMAGYGGGRLRNPPVRKILEDQIIGLQKELDARKELLKKLDENKNVEEILDALRKVGI